MNVVLTKLSDNRFNGKHPNGVHPGYVTRGNLIHPPVVGESCIIVTLRGYFETSTVIELLPDGVFKTLNSTYKIEHIP